jgi:hypothetical protein
MQAQSIRMEMHFSHAVLVQIQILLILILELFVLQSLTVTMRLARLVNSAIGHAKVRMVEQHGIGTPIHLQMVFHVVMGYPLIRFVAIGYVILTSHLV